MAIQVLHFGAVTYTYAIGKYEVTLNQYTEFLNAVAATDTYGLYNTNMGTDLNIKGITRSGSSGSYTYAVSGNGTRPVTYVSWLDAARFTNWLHNGQPTGLQTYGTTEEGAYSIPVNDGFSHVVPRTPEAQYWLPSEDEWYKAAYYQPANVGGDTDGYWNYATRTNAIPNSRNGSNSDPNSGNFYRDDGLANGFNGGYAITNSPSFSSSQDYLMAVGSFTEATSYYGTYDQGGNVTEWSEGLYGAGDDMVDRGGGWLLDEYAVQPQYRRTDSMMYENYFIGFRVATVPEPASAMLLVGGGALLALRRRRG